MTKTPRPKTHTCDLKACRKSYAPVVSWQRFHVKKCAAKYHLERHWRKKLGLAK